MGVFYVSKQKGETESWKTKADNAEFKANWK